MHHLGSRAKSLLFSLPSIFAGLMLCLLALQGVALAFHDGQHLSGKVQRMGSSAPVLDAADCVRCAVLHAPGIEAGLPTDTSPSLAPRVLDWELVVIARSSFVSRLQRARAPPV